MYYCNSDKEPEELNYLELTNIRVCGGYDSLSCIKSKQLIEDNRHLKFYKLISEYRIIDQGSVIRWLYRGLTLEQALAKVNHQIQVREYCIAHKVPKR